MHAVSRFSPLLFLLGACVSWEVPDVDQDGILAADGDCNDADPNVGPGMPEIWYDGIDQDCSGTSDFDFDEDGFDWEEDCDDTDPSSYPGALEIEGDGLDQDCDGWDLVSEAEEPDDGEEEESEPPENDHVPDPLRG